MMVMDRQDEICIGSRIESNGHHATVRFVGEVPGTKGVWLGVEWDDSSRGKHDGSKDGVRYFRTRTSTSGSFLRSKMVNTGISLIKALHERYGITEDETAGVIEEELYVVGKGKQTTVEMVGAKSVNLQQSQFDKLREVALRGEPVSNGGLPGEIARTLSNLTDLDISKTLIGSWKTIADIALQLKQLKTLNASDNRLAIPENASVLNVAFQQLKTLFLNRCAYDWQQIKECSVMWPHLETLHVCFNDITEISDSASELSSLRLLNLESNPVGSWERVKKLGNLPRLETLILNDCGIETMDFQDVAFGSTTPFFRNLKGLSLFHNKIAQMSSINELLKLSQLEDIKFRFNPLTGEFKSEEDLRQLIIAKLPKLKMYNRSEIDAEERKGAEVDYLKEFGVEWKKSGGNQDPAKNSPSEQFTFAHPRYQEIIDKYGPPEDSELVKKSTALKDNLIEVTFQCSNLPNKPPIKKKLPRTMTVQKLKAMMQRLYKGDPETMKVAYTSDEMVGHHFEFDNNMREISFYAVEQGDTIHVSW